jgi:hypothetical protein
LACFGAPQPHASQAVPRHLPSSKFLSRYKTSPPLRSNPYLVAILLEETKSFSSDEEVCVLYE